MRRVSEASLFPLVLQGKKSLFITGRTSIGCRKKKKHYSVPGMFVCVIQHRNWPLSRPYSTHTAPTPVLTGSVHAHILTKPSRAGFTVIRSELIEPGAATCVYNEARPRDRSDRGRFLGMPGPFFKSLHSFTYMNPTSRLRAGGREQWTVLSGTGAIGHGLHVADWAQGLTGT